MFSFLQKIRDAVDGKKTIITAVIGILTAALAWAAGELTDMAFLGAIWVGIQIIFIRVGNKKDVANRVDVVNTQAYTEAHDAGFDAGFVAADSGYGTGFVDGYEQGDEEARYEDE